MRLGLVTVRILTPEGTPLPETSSGHVRATPGAVYVLELTNHAPRRALVSVRIDGALVSGPGLVIGPQATARLERPVHATERGRFTMAPEGHDALGADGGRDNADLGLIVVTHQLEAESAGQRPLNTPGIAPVIQPIYPGPWTPYPYPTTPSGPWIGGPGILRGPSWPYGTTITNEMPPTIGVAADVLRGRGHHIEDNVARSSDARGYRLRSVAATDGGASEPRITFANCNVIRDQAPGNGTATAAMGTAMNTMAAPNAAAAPATSNASPAPVALDLDRAKAIGTILTGSSTQDFEATSIGTLETEQTTIRLRLVQGDAVLPGDAPRPLPRETRHWRDMAPPARPAARP